MNQASSKQNHKNIFVTLKEIFANKKVVTALLITLFLVLFFHIGTMLTMPLVKLPASYQPNGESFIDMLNLLSGGGLSRMSIFAIGVGPYITSQIIIQLLSGDLIKPLSRMSKSGERGRKKLEIITRLLTLPFCLVQAYATIALVLSPQRGGGSSGITINGHGSLSELSFGTEILPLMILLTAGTYIAIFIGDMITKRGIGNGITIIILVGIVSSLFSSFSYAFNYIGSKMGAEGAITVVLSCILYTSFFLAILLIIVFANGSTRKIPIQQTGQGLTEDKNQLPYLPIKLISAGVLPVIFSSSIMTIPGTIAQFLSESDGKWFIMDYLTLQNWSGIVIYFLLTVLFTFFYSYVQTNPNQLSENFLKSGKFIPGVRIGDDTEKHITKVLMRVNWIGGPLLGVIASLPYILALTTGIPSGIALGGTGIIILVSGSLELWSAIKSTATTSGYTVAKQNISQSHLEDEQDKIVQLW